MHSEQGVPSTHLVKSLDANYQCLGKSVEVQLLHHIVLCAVAVRTLPISIIQLHS